MSPPPPKKKKHAMLKQDLSCQHIFNVPLLVISLVAVPPVNSHCQTNLFPPFRRLFSIALSPPAVHRSEGLLFSVYLF